KPSDDSTQVGVLYLLIVAGLVTARVLVDDLDFISMGWIMVLAAIPLAPRIWLLVAPALREVAPFINKVGVGPVEIEFRAVEAVDKRADAGAIDQFAGFADPGETPGPENTLVMELAQVVIDARDSGASAVVVDLQAGNKWRYPNLYFLARILELEPLVS